MMIATRVLKLRTTNGDIDIPIRIFAPKPDDRSWQCRFEIDWPEGKLERAAGGVDSVQAVQLALQMIGVIIYTSEHHASGNLFFEASDSGYGFPVTANLRDLLIGSDKKFF